jgi:hypothetical protein
VILCRLTVDGAALPALQVAWLLQPVVVAVVFLGPHSTVQALS